MPITRYIRSFASLAAGATQGLQTPHIAIRVCRESTPTAESKELNTL